MLKDSRVKNNEYRKAKEIVISAINTALEGKAEITEDMQLKFA